MASDGKTTTEAGPSSPASRRETYGYMDHKYLFDVNQANEIVKDGRRPVQLEDESVRQSIQDSELNNDHVDRVDPSLPGIIAYVFCRTPKGELIRGHLLIDGHHRAARCLQLNQPFWAYLLTEEESLAVLLRSPEGSPKRGEDLISLRHNIW